MSPFLFVPRTIVSFMLNVNGIGIFRAACWPLEEKSRLNDENFKVGIFLFFFLKKKRVMRRMGYCGLGRPSTLGLSRKSLFHKPIQCVKPMLEM